MEDAMLIHRIMRAPDKRKIMIDIGNIPPAEVDTHMQRIIDRMKKIPLMDPKTGDYNLKYNRMNITEDFYLPSRGKDSGTDIQNLPGLQFNAIEDIEYLRNKLMAAFKVPKSFLGYEEDNSGKASLAAQDVRFARTIERVQRIILSELTKIAIIHLYVQGFRDEELVDFDLEMTSPSVIYEQEKINLWKEKIGLATTIADSKFLSREWIYHNILQIAPAEAANEAKKVMKDIIGLAKLAAKEQEAQQPPQPEQGGMPGAESQPGMEAPPEGEPGQETPPEGEQPPEQVDDVDAILASLEEPNEHEEQVAEDIELEEAKMGRPPEGQKYGQDSHPRGRDPLGHKENLGAMQIGQKRKQSKKSPLSLEQVEISRLIKQLEAKALVSVESTSILNEDNILDIDEKPTE